MPLTTGARLGPYEILAPLGAGGMGEVYLARDARLGRNVALKVLPEAFSSDPNRMARFEREAQVLASLNHPSIAALYGLEESGGVRALVMELVEGPTLAERIWGPARVGPVPLDEALPIARQIAEALEAAHEKGIIHRDLKPANVKVTGEGVVKVLDFGLAKALSGDPTASDPSNSPTLSDAATRAGMILGTAGYMSPEQAKGKVLDRRTDIWSFGVVLFEMLSGHRMYAGESAAETLASVIKDEPRWEALPASTPAAIRKLLRRCLDRDPKRRLRDIGEARIAIDEALAGAPAKETLASAPPAPAPSRAFLPWLLAAVAGLAAVALAFLHFRETPPAERVLRYAVQSPEKSSIQTFAISPDGHYLAIAAAIEGKRQLFVRPLDGLQARPLPDTEGASYPFWSPDSRFIGFFADGKLRKVAVNGGPSQALCDAPDGRGGAWSRDGVILFAPAPTGGLRRVPDTGGAPVPVTQTPHDNRYPVFLPDGRYFFYLSGRESPEKDGVWLALLDSKEARRVLPDISSVAFAPPASGSRLGHVLFLRENKLMALPFDVSTLQPAGEAFPVAEGASFSAHLAHAAVSVSDSGVLVYQTGADTAAGPSQVNSFDRSGKRLSPVGSPGFIAGSALSPDGKTLALSWVANPLSAASDIWLHDFSRGTDTRFTFHPSQNFTPVWSPDGSRIVFASDRSRTLHLYDLYQKRTDGSGQEELLLSSSYRKVPQQWSQDGRFLLYAEMDSRNKWHLWFLPNPGAGHQKPIPFLKTEFNEPRGQLSPDSRWIAHESDESGSFEVYVRPFPSGGEKWKISTAGGAQPRWRSDGKELFYLAPNSKLMAVAVKARPPSAKTAFEASAPEPLFEVHTSWQPITYPFYQYDVAADGKRFLMQTPIGEAGEASLNVIVNWLAGAKK